MSQDTVPAVLDEESVETNNSVVEVTAAASMLGRIGAHTKWANCPDRRAATAQARAALEQKFLDQAGGDPSAPRASASSTTPAWR